jgi:hypothetical protein
MADRPPPSVTDSRQSWVDRQRSPEEVALLQEFFNHPGWVMVQRALLDFKESEVRRLIDHTDPLEMARAQGLVKGLDKGLSLREVLLSKPPRRPS